METDATKISPYSSYSGDFLDTYGTPEKKHSVDEGNLTIQVVSINKHKSLSVKVDRSWLKVAALILNTGIFITSAALSVQESLRSKPNISLLGVYDGLLGLSNFGFCTEVLASDAEFNFPNLFNCLGCGKETVKLTGKDINRFLCAWSYASVFIFTQGFDNIPQRRYYILLFIYALGLVKAKDIYSLLTMDQSKFELSSPLQESEETIRTLGFATRDYSWPAITWLGATVVSSVALTALNFAYPLTWGEYGKIGLYQTCIAMYSGSVGGDLFARGYERILEKLEMEHSTKLIESQKSAPLYAMRIGRTLFALFSPLMVNTLLAVKTQPNSVPDYFAKLCVGGIYGANLLIARKEFENAASSFHRVSFSIYDDSISCTERAKAVAKKYFPSIAFFAAVVIYFSVVASVDSARDGYAILTFLATMLSSFVITDLVALGRERLKNYRAFNELVFRLLYGSIPLCIYYMMLSHLIKIGNRHLNHDSAVLYGLQLTEWALLGINMGNDRGVYIQPEIPGMLPITSPIAMTELTKAFVNNF